MIRPCPGAEIDLLLVATGSPHAQAARVAATVGIPPLGLAQVAAVAARKGLRVRVADLNLKGWTAERFDRCLRLQRPVVVGISCLTESYRNAIRLAARVRRILPRARIVAGGPHVTFEDAAALRTGVFDVVVRGEGEETAAELFPRLVAGLPPDRSIEGISFLDGKRVVRAPDRPRVEDLDSLPWPARELLPMERYGSPGAVLTGRGCPGRCVFCAAAALSGGRHRCRQPAAVLDEIVALHGGGVREILFLDDTLTGDRARLEQLLERLQRSRIRFGWGCEARLESVDRDLLRRMAKLGCHTIQYGIESGSATSRRRAGKPLLAQQVEAALRETDRAGITPVCSFVLGLPWEDAAAIRETVELGLHLQRRYLAAVGFGMLVCYPGTALWIRGAALGLRRRTGDFDLHTMHVPTCDTPHVDRAALRRLHFEAALRQVQEMPPALKELSAHRALARALESEAGITEG